jgi:hypothetical protein
MCWVSRGPSKIVKIADYGAVSTGKRTTRGPGISTDSALATRGWRLFPAPANLVERGQGAGQEGTVDLAAAVGMLPVSRPRQPRRLTAQHVDLGLPAAQSGRHRAIVIDIQPPAFGRAAPPWKGSLKRRRSSTRSKSESTRCCGGAYLRDITAFTARVREPRAPERISPRPQQPWRAGHHRSAGP